MNEKIKEIKEKFERGEIAQSDIDIETQKEIAKLFEMDIKESLKNISLRREEIGELEDDIEALNEEEKFYDQSIETLDNLVKYNN